jgi:hypothetical protein
MSARISVDERNAPLIFSTDRLVTSVGLESFACSIPEYNEWLVRDALRSQDDLIAATYLLRERNTGAIAAYMALVSDAIKLSVAEKELHNLKYPFKTIPAMKVAKLAVSAPFREKYQGVGSLYAGGCERNSAKFQRNPFFLPLYHG